MTEAEKLLCIINEISANKRIGIFEAVILYAEENSIEIEDLIPVLDTHIIEKIQHDALKHGIVCNRSLFEKKTTSLF